MAGVRPKKNLGQHFLKDKNIALRIVNALEPPSGINKVLELGPGMGVLTQFLMQRPELDTYVLEIDNESVDYLLANYEALNGRVIAGDFLKYPIKQFSSEPFSLIGNFPYNISSQIFFKVLEHRDQIPMVVGMLQKEVAERICAGPGSKTYGILSVLLQAYYDTEYLFTVHEDVFDPPPKVKSGVLRLTRNSKTELGCNPSMFKQVVKMSFNQRRKTLRNSLRAIQKSADLSPEILAKRPEQLSVDEFIFLTKQLE